MRLLAAFLLLAVTTGAALGEKPSVELNPHTRTPCDLMTVAYDWDFATGPHGFYNVDCDQSGQPVWEHGPTGSIPDPPPRVWATILESDYPNDSGEGLVSPHFVVGPQSWFVQVTHYFVIESGYDGANVSVGIWPASQVIEPEGGYTGTISTSASYYAHCVDSEPGWSGSSDGWRMDCFDLSEYMGQQIALEFDFGSDISLTDAGWFLAAVRVGVPALPEAACCFPLTGECRLVPEEVCAEQGGEWNPEWETCDPNPCPQPPYHPIVHAGPWINAEPWHDYIPLIPGQDIEVTLDLPAVVLPPEEIAAVEFNYSPDLGATWHYLGADFDGYQPNISTVDSEATPRGNGWGIMTPIPEDLPDPGIPALYRAVVRRHQGDALEFETARMLDPAPPELVTVNVEDWTVLEGDTLMLQLSQNGCEVELVTVFFCPKFDEFVKGVPGIWQIPHSDWHCAPAATAQCLKYFEQALGDVVITGGLSEFELVMALATPMATNTYELGTLLSDWKAGLAQWIQTHGAGYTLRTKVYFHADGTPNWNYGKWATLRNEVERGMDVLVAVFWQTGGSHAMTLEAVINTPLPGGRIRIGFKDPWTAQTEWGELDPYTGWIYNLSGAGGGGNAYLGVGLIVAPVEPEPDWAGEPCDVVYRGVLPGGPAAIPINIPEIAGMGFMHIIVQNDVEHARLISRVVTREGSGITGHQGAPAGAFFLGAASPNPFHDTTVMSYGAPRSARATLAIFDVTGRSVRTLVDGMLLAGIHQVAWDARDNLGRPVDSGIYYARLVVEGRREGQRLIVIR